MPTHLSARQRVQAVQGCDVAYAYKSANTLMPKWHLSLIQICTSSNCKKQLKQPIASWQHTHVQMIQPDNATAISKDAVQHSAWWYQGCAVRSRQSARIGVSGRSSLGHVTKGQRSLQQDNSANTRQMNIDCRGRNQSLPTHEQVCSTTTRGSHCSGSSWSCDLSKQSSFNLLWGCLIGSWWHREELDYNTSKIIKQACEGDRYMPTPEHQHNRETWLTERQEHWKWAYLNYKTYCHVWFTPNYKH